MQKCAKLVGFAAGLAPASALAHGGHGELGASHELWHAVPIVAAVAVGVFLAVRLVRRSRS